ncbi:MAG: hypothetical protein ABW146_01225 [Candidatus Sedimenticola sp. 6PFRAG7]
MSGRSPTNKSQIDASTLNQESANNNHPEHSEGKNMSLKKHLKNALLPALVCLIPTAQAFDLYRQPHVPYPDQMDSAKSCIEIEQEMVALQPRTYSYQPGFYEDPYTGASVMVGTTILWPAYAALGYIGYVDYQEKGRIISAENRIQELRYLKAQKRCFES